jgi:hypothetical protein
MREFYTTGFGDVILLLGTGPPDRFRLYPIARRGEQRKHTYILTVGDAVLVTDIKGSRGCQAVSLSHYVVDRLTDVTKVVSLTG